MRFSAICAQVELLGAAFPSMENIMLTLPPMRVSKMRRLSKQDKHSLSLLNAQEWKGRLLRMKDSKLLLLPTSMAAANATILI